MGDPGLILTSPTVYPPTRVLTGRYKVKVKLQRRVKSLLALDLKMIRERN